MAISLLTATASSISDTLDTDGLVTQLNTTLSALLNIRVMGVSFAARSEERVIGNELQATLTYDLSGAVMGAPFVALAFQDKTPAAVKAAIDSFVAAHPGYFYSTVWIEPVASPRRGVQYVGLVFYNVSATEGAANWIVNGAPATIPTGNTAWVDAVNGDDATGARGFQDKPFLTIQAAITAATGGDTVKIRPGTYTLAAAITLKNSVILDFAPGAFVNGMPGGVAFSDGGVAINNRITGDAVLNVGVNGGLIGLTGNGSILFIECVEVFAPSVAFASAIQLGGGGNQTVSLIAKRDISCSGGGQPFARIDAAGVTLSISSPSITADSFLSINAGSPVVRVIAGKIATGNYVVSSANASPVVFLQSDIITTGGPVLNFTGTGAPNVELVIGSAVISGLVRSTVNGTTVRVRAMEITSDAGNNLVYLQSAGSQSVAIECVGDILAATAAIYNSFGDNYVVIKAKNLAISGGNPVIAAVDSNPNVVLDIAESLSGATIITAVSGLATLHFDIRAMEIFGTDQVIRIDVGVVVGTMVASRRIVGGLIIKDIATSASQVQVSAPTITATDGATAGLFLSNNGAVVYDIDCADVLTCGVRLNTGPNGVLRLRAGSHLGQNAAVRLCDVFTGTAFLHYDEARGLAGAGAAAVYCRGGTTHVMGGRMIGADGDAGGNAVTIGDDSALVRIYPGAVLIAGNDAATRAIGLDGLAATPTVVAMGAIAANKAADAGVVIAVGSLLVDPAVV